MNVVFYCVIIKWQDVHSKEWCWFCQYFSFDSSVGIAGRQTTQSTSQNH